MFRCCFQLHMGKEGKKDRAGVNEQVYTHIQASNGTIKAMED